MATQANQQSWNTNSPQALGDTNYWQTGDLVYNNNQNPVIATTGTATISTNTITLPATAASLGVISGMKVVSLPGTSGGVPADTVVVSVSASTATISKNVTVALAVTPIQFLTNTIIPSGWICTQAGNPGVWEPVTPSPTGSITTTQTLGTLTGLYRFVLLNPATTGTYSLPEAANIPAASVITIKNIASGSVTLTPLATDAYVDAAAITLAQYAKIALATAGSTNWYAI